MLSAMIKENQTRQQLRKEEQDRRRKAAMQSSTNLTHALVDHLNVAVAQAYLNQRRLDTEARRLEQSAAVLQRQTQRWIALVDGFCSALKQLGDVTSWAAAMHKDVTEVTFTLQHAYSTTYSSLHHSTAPHNPRHSGGALLPPTSPALPTTPEHSTDPPQSSASADQQSEGDVPCSAKSASHHSNRSS